MESQMNDAWSDTVNEQDQVEKLTGQWPVRRTAHVGLPPTTVPVWLKENAGRRLFESASGACCFSSLF
jgi:hypothetical protein